MFRIPRDKPWPPAIDLGTVRETITYMRDDMRRIPGLERAGAALDAALNEIRDAEAQLAPRQTLPPRFARFLPRTGLPAAKRD